MQFALDSKWQITAWNETLGIASDFACDEIAGLDFLEWLVDYPDRAALLEVLSQAYNVQEDVHDFGFTLYSKSADPIRLLLDLSPYFDEAQASVGVLISARSVSQNHHEPSCDTLHFALNTRWCLTAWNKAAEKAFNFERSDVLGRNFSSFVPLDDQYDHFEQALDQIFHRREDVSDFKLTLYSKSGMPINLILNMCPLHTGDSGKKVVGVSISARFAPQTASVSDQKDELCEYYNERITATSEGRTTATSETLPILSPSSSTSSLGD